MKKTIGIWMIIAAALGMAGSAFGHFGMAIPSDNMVMQNDNRSVNLQLFFSHPMEMVGMELVKPKVFGVFFEDTQKVFIARFGDDLSVVLITEIKEAYEALRPEIPYIGGKGNMFTEWLNYGAYYLAMYRVLSARGHSLNDVGNIIFETYEVMADYPKWFLRIVGHFKYGKKYEDKLRQAAAVSQKRKYPGDFVSSFIEGDGENFDYGLDITECGICKLYAAQGAERMSRYMCLSDYVVSKAFNRGLVRYKTIAEGAKKCDFRFKKGRETFVYPLRKGWPPKFFDNDTELP